MNPQDPLAQLHPLRQPELIGWWPLAPGWWILIVLVITALLALAWLLLRRYRANAYRRQALLQLSDIYSAFEQDGDQLACLQQVNALLKSVALRAYPQRQVAAICGEAWQAFLQESCPAGKDLALPPPEAHYRSGTADLDMAALKDSARVWISRHEVCR